jgi:hypothetical protein
LTTTTTPSTASSSAPSTLELALLATSIPHRLLVLLLLHGLLKWLLHRECSMLNRWYNLGWGGLRQRHAAI